MPDPIGADAPPFRPVVIGALYTGIERGLAADLLAVRALEGMAYTVCTAHVVASNGVVTDVLEVPADTVEAQLSHLFEALPLDAAPNAAKLGIVGHPRTVEAAFRRLETHLEGPLLLDLTLSGPSGEDVISAPGLEALKAHLDRPHLVTLRRIDAELLAGMELKSLDDAQVAVQRLHKLGARRVLVRCGQLPARFFESQNDADAYAVDLYYDGEEFSLFEAPHLPQEGLHGASSAFTLSLLRQLVLRKSVVEAIQAAKIYTTEAIRLSNLYESASTLNFFWNYRVPDNET